MNLSHCKKTICGAKLKRTFWQENKTCESLRLRIKTFEINWVFYLNGLQSENFWVGGLHNSSNWQSPTKLSDSCCFIIWYARRSCRPYLGAMFFLKMGQPRPLFRLFSSFQTNITIFTTNKWEKYPFSIQRWDSNPRPLEYESPPMTTRPGLPPLPNIFSVWRDINSDKKSYLHICGLISFCALSHNFFVKFCDSLH